MGRALFGNEVQRQTLGPQVLRRAKPFTISAIEAESWQSRVSTPEALARQAAADTLRYQREFTAAALGQEAMEALFAAEGPQPNSQQRLLGGVAVVGVIQRERQTVLV